MPSDRAASEVLSAPLSSQNDSAELEFLRKVARGDSTTDVRDEAGAAPEGADWAGARFVVGRRLGAGGFGAVYEAFDREQGAIVALKTPTRRGARTLYDFKREFRALADLAHTNLVQLYELHGDEERWFFTMELVRGDDWLTHLRKAAPEAVLSAVRQLADGLRFLHATGRIHRDVKPSNVRVTVDGRVVLLDFGLVQDAATGVEGPGRVAGTPRYMAPEQLRADPTRPIGPAADWYAFGTMLHEALDARGPEAANELGRLAELALDLRAPAPEDRPSGDVVVARLAGGGEELAPPAVAPSVFVGRRRELALLNASLEAALRGHSRVVAVHGPSGIGKTSLVARALADMRARHPEVCFLSGRCFGQESVPLATLDALVDDLARRLVHTPFIVPADAAPLVRVFPTLGRAPALAHVQPIDGDAVSTRRRAVAALADILAQLAPLVVSLDDVHYGDQDGATLLVEVLRKRAGAMLLVLTYRSDDAPTSPCLATLLPALAVEKQAFEFVTYALGPLADTEVKDLVAHATQRGSDALNPARLEHWTRESGGSPFFVHELCRSGTSEAPRSLAALLSQRVTQLPIAARSLLELLTVHGQPLTRSVAGDAVALGDAEPAVVGLLRQRSFVVTRRSTNGDELIDVSHDQVRGAVLATLDGPKRRAHHAALARALAAQGGAPPEVLAMHYQSAGELERATQLWVQAAEAAERVLAFVHAARLYERVSEALSSDDPRRAMALERRGQCLAHAGRGAEAAGAYLAAAALVPRTEAVTLRRRAAEQFLLSGRLEEGLPLLRSALTEVGLAWPRTETTALLRWLGGSVPRRIRGLAFRARTAAELPAKTLARIDTATAAAVSLAMVDPMRGVYFHGRALALALAAGEPERLLRVLGIDIGIRAALRGHRPQSRSDRLNEQLAETLRASLPGDAPVTQSLNVALAVARGARYMFRNELDRAIDALETAVDGLVAAPVHLGNDLTMARTWLGYALYMRGSWAKLRVHAAVALADARARGDHFGELSHGGWAAVFELIADRPERARQVHDEFVRRRGTPSALEALIDALDRGLIALYADRGRGPAALNEITPRLGLRTSFIAARLSSLVAAVTRYQFGMALTAAAASAVGRSSTGHLRRAERCARRLGRLGTPAAHAMAAALWASIAATRGDLATARAYVSDAEARFAAIPMGVHAAAARRRRAQLMSGSDAAALIASADAALSAEGICDPARLTAMLLPGAWPDLRA